MSTSLQSGPAAEVAPSFEAAIACAEAALAALRAVPASAVSGAELLRVIEQAGVISTRLDALSTQWIRQAVAVGAITEAGASSAFAWLRGHLRVAPGAAAARLHLIDQLALPRCAATSDAFAAGTLSTAHTQVVARTLASLPYDLSTSVLAEAEKTLLAQAEHLDPGALRSAAQRLRGVLDPSTAESRARREFEQCQARSLTLTDCADGFVWIRGQLDVEAAGWVRAVLDAKSGPRPATELGPDPRSAATRRADAFVDVFKEAANTGTLPTHGGAKPTLIVTMDYHQLVNDLGVGTLPDGQVVSPRTVRRLACDAQIIPAVLGTNSHVLDLGRSAYRASLAQRRALEIRDQGCVNPTCNAPPAWCDVHHVVPFALGGRTDTNAMVLVCAFDHRLIHEGRLIVAISLDGDVRVVRAVPGTEQPL